MIAKLVTAAIFIAISVGSAQAQFGGLNSRGSQRPASPPAKQSASTSWEQLPAVVLACIEERMQETTKMGIRELQAQNVRPSDPPIQGLIEQCTVKASKPSASSASRSPSPADKVRTFIEWFNTDVLARQPFRSAFLQCKTIMLEYQSGLLNGLRTQVSSSSSKQEQQLLSEILDALSQNQRVTLDVACVKVFIASLRIAGSKSGWVGDELSILNSSLSDRAFELVPLARTKIDDLTDEGIARLASKMSLADLDKQSLGTELAATSQRFPVSGDLSCLITHEWVSRFSTDAFCHRSLVENSLSTALSTMPLPNK